MRGRSRPPLLAALTLAAACGGGPGGEPAEPTPPAAAAERLEVPFTAEQIRDEWVAGLTLDLQITAGGVEGAPGRQEWQRWTVVAADAEGAEVDYLLIDAEGRPLAPAQRRRSGWQELRDHASFPAASAERQRVRRNTALGELEGWMYTVRDPEAGTVTEYFFADELPGAPVWMESRRGDEVMMAVQQLRRGRSEVSAEAPPAPIAPD